MSMNIKCRLKYFVARVNTGNNVEDTEIWNKI